MKKRIISLVIAVAAALCLAPSAFALVEQSEEYYVNDSAAVLSEETEELIINYNGDLEYYCKGAQIVVVTVEYLDGMYSDEYAGALFENWGVGDGTEHNGMLLLLATGENKAWLTVGKGITGSFTDRMVDEYFEDYFWDDFDRGDYDDAVQTMFVELAYWMADHYGVQTTESPVTEGEHSNNAGERAASAFGDLLAVAVIVIIFIAISSSNYRYGSRRRAYRSGFDPFTYMMFSNLFRSGMGGHRRGPFDDDDDHRGPGGFGGSGGSSGGGFGGSSGGFGGSSGGGFGSFGSGGGSGFGGGGGMGGGGGRR